MSLSKFKICPVCEDHNDPSRLECKKCEADLTSVKIVDESSLSTEPKTTTNLVKQCDCGAVNSAQARKCVSCGEDISDIRPAILQTIAATKKFYLRSINDDHFFVLEKDITVIGREAEMKDYLSTKPYVSRQHAKFTVTNGNVYIDNMGATNSIFVNNSPILSNASILLKNGDEIGIGGKLVNGNRQNGAAYFTFEVIL
jgi:ribosomal protein L40E